MNRRLPQCARRECWKGMSPNDNRQNFTSKHEQSSSSFGSFSRQILLCVVAGESWTIPFRLSLVTDGVSTDRVMTRKTFSKDHGAH